MSAAVTPHDLRRYHAGELSTERRAEIEATLATDAALQARLDDLKASDAAFKASMPFERFVADHEARAAATASAAARLAAWWRRLAMAGGASVLVAAAALVVAVNLGGPPSPDDIVQASADRERPKGAGVGIGYFVEEHDGVRIGHEGDAFAQGDRIQFAVRDAPEASAMVIVGVDGKGAVTTYAAQSLATREKGGKARVLTESVVLDDAVGAERFFVVYGAGPLDALQRDAEAAARRLAADRADLAATRTLPIDDPRVVQSSVHIVKVRR